MFAHTPAPPYWAVIFSSQRSDVADGYGDMADAMVALAAQQPGYLGVESVRSDDGFGITVSYWASEEAIAGWKAEGRHRLAQAEGYARWYAELFTRVACVGRDHHWTRG
ncbi:antibiotic biosynthesis monooxygenase family protein [Craterilacuibacter sinensis]|uniref:Antibiotic biosynthesis monooxygenase n=1 Tax=Craterilacuibacter sinensis TaxID=2686017 RepID=A0A845BKE9_9NEIS|nr:antibiotic biosynthesis monooxygenase [Craterilacuibacter sinensis]MXR36805.1 antibiotic biosynthesis monooxygenase [Craterilacuibacter sinensis]RQW29221.1 antibiotic biosynthesis monooxygenase [Rhodobacteraceae bacterium CH30]